MLARGLSTPLTLTLLRDTYQPGDDVSELLDPTRYGTADDLEQHLIGRVLPAAYTPPRPAPTPLHRAAGPPGADLPRPTNEPGPHPRRSMIAKSAP